MHAPSGAPIRRQPEVLCAVHSRHIVQGGLRFAAQHSLVAFASPLVGRYEQVRLAPSGVDLIQVRAGRGRQGRAPRRRRRADEVSRLAGDGAGEGQRELERVVRLLVGHVRLALLAGHVVDVVARVVGAAVGRPLDACLVPAGICALTSSAVAPSKPGKPGAASGASAQHQRQQCGPVVARHVSRAVDRRVTNSRKLERSDCKQCEREGDGPAWRVSTIKPAACSSAAAPRP
mmetsp:Transcript_39605/g.92577  ORF Transcript_39605/g.92577 Transcript_39605/m.92577 type:complete len:232 (+) Transcript_39605:259-954(+)